MSIRSTKTALATAVVAGGVAGMLAACTGGAAVRPTSSAVSAPTSTTRSVSSTATSATPARCSSGAAPTLTGVETAYETAAPLESTRSLAGQVGSPTLSSAPSGVTGWQVAIVPVSAQVSTNGTFAVSPGSFVLVDASGQRCAAASKNPSARAFSIIQVDPSHPGSGDVAFLVPEGADLHGYSVMYTEQVGGRAAIARWDASTSSATATTAAGCDGRRSAYDVSKVSVQPFGTLTRAGSTGVTVAITPTAPSLRELPPSDRQPSSVDGLALTVSVTAGGSIGYVNREQFQLLDSRGILCRFSQLGSTGETLSTDLVPTGQTRTYTLIFWLPRGSSMSSWKLLYLKDPSSGTVNAVWTGATVASPSSTSSPTLTTRPTSTPGAQTPRS